MGRYPPQRAPRTQLDGHRRLRADERAQPTCTRCGAAFDRQWAELWCYPCIRQIVEADNVDVELRALTRGATPR